MKNNECCFIEDNLDETKGVPWRYVSDEQDSDTVFPYNIEPRRSNGSQYLNTHSRHITQMFGCNSNIQIGSPRCVFYVVHYSTKSTQAEDRGTDFDLIGYQIMRRIIKEKMRLEKEKLVKDSQSSTSTDKNNEDDEDYCFREGLNRFLIGMSVHLSSDVVSATMAHLLICQKGSRFTYSHPFRNLLVNQMYDHLSGKEPGSFVLRRRNRGENKEVMVWADYSINDYLYRPDDLEDISFYRFGMLYEKVPFSFNRMSILDENGLPAVSGQERHFNEGHPGRRFCYLRPTSEMYIPKLSLPKDMLCNLDQLDLENSNNEPISKSSLECREDYAKIALMLFHPFRDETIFDISAGELPTVWFH